MFRVVDLIKYVRKRRLKVLKYLIAKMHAAAEIKQQKSEQQMQIETMKIQTLIGLQIEATAETNKMRKETKLSLNII